MKFLCDVHISFKLAKQINTLGFECIHVNTILDKWFTTDAKIAAYTDDNDYILITKDFDFKNSFFINKTPKKLIKINLGNISNETLIAIFNHYLSEISIIDQNNESYMIEIDSNFIKVTSHS